MLRAGVMEIARPTRPARPDLNKNGGFLIVQGSTQAVQPVHLAMSDAHGAVGNVGMMARRLGV